METEKNIKTKIANANGSEYWLVMNFGDYCLLQSVDTAEDFVVAWLLKFWETEHTYTWEQGHYCQGLHQAVETFNEKINPKVRFVYSVITADSDNIGNEINVRIVTHNENEARACFAELAEKFKNTFEFEELIIDEDNTILALFDSDEPSYWMCEIFKNEISS